MEPITHTPDTKLDLYLERVVDIAPELVWAAWTQAEHIVHWFTPAPWQTTACEIDLRPGGVFATTMRSPEGQDFPNEGCVLEVVANRKFVWTGELLRGYRPRPTVRPDGKPCDDIAMTVVISLAPAPNGGTRYSALAIHKDEAGRKAHAEMGFHDGWNAALDQLVAYMKAQV